MNKESKKRLTDLVKNDKITRFPLMAKNAPDAISVNKYTDKKANGLTKCIVDFIKLTGGQAERISVTGRYKDTSIEFTDVIGNRRRVGTVTWLKSSMKKGSADISATIDGRSVKIEVKIGHDRMSDEQYEYKEAIERAGGIYYIAHNFDDFLIWYDLTFIYPAPDCDETF